MGRPREFEREKALEQAMDLFWSQGYESTGMSALCDQMGLGRQSVYNTFGDKESLFAEALGHYRQKMLRPMVDMLDSPGSGLSNVETVLEMWNQRAHSESDNGCLMANSIAEFGMKEPKISQALAFMLGEMEAAFYRALKQAEEAGELPAGRDPKALARLLTTVGQGLSAIGKVDRSGAFARDAITSVRSLLH